MQTEPSLHLVTRRTDTNPNHHIWKNNGTWWLHFTLRSTTASPSSPPNVGAIFGRRLSSRMRIAEKSKGGGDIVLVG
jgi:hypothetical protein